ncbi:MAG: TrkH family potassium uptake protein [Succinivibrio sp.]
MVIDFRLVAKLLSPALFSFGVIAFIPAVYALLNDARGALAFISTGVIALATSFVCKYLGKKAGTYTSLRILFLFTTSLWIIVSLIAAIPFYFQLPELSFSKSLFEACSGLSTTGSTVISYLESKPKSLLLWRAILQYIGGVGFVALAVVILPLSAVGGMNIFKTESQSFDDTAKFTPHLKTMTISLFIWYIAVLSTCTCCYVFCGLDLFNAITTAMTTVSTGGMTNTDASMNTMPHSVQYVAMGFMFISSLPFLIILASLSGNYRFIFKDQQVRGFVMLILIAGTMVAVSLIYENGYGAEKAFRISFFNVIAILSTTGYSLEDFSLWNPLASMVFLFILAIGGCSGSTSGGIKIFRLQICYSMFKTQLQKLVHPHIVSEPRFKGKIIDPDTLSAVITYLVSYMVLAMASSTVASILGLDLGDAITGTVSCLSNIGPALGTTLNPSTNFSQISDPLAVLFSIDMIMGRLEILPVLLCFTRMFYKR